MVDYSLIKIGPSKSIEISQHKCSFHFISRDRCVDHHYNRMNGEG